MRHFNMPKYRLYDLFEVLVGLLGLIASIISIATYAIIPNSQLAFFYIVVVTSAFIIIFIKTVKMTRVSQDRLYDFSESFHRYTDLLRDKTYVLQSLYEADRLTYGLVLQNAGSFGQQTVDILSTLISNSTDERVSVCIKYFPDDQPRPDANGFLQEEDYYLKTLSRSTNTVSDRLNNDGLVPILGNTAFMTIMNERKSYFRSSNLKELKKIDAYDNTNQHWEKYYNATIVVPIRMKMNISNAEIPDSRYNLLGFLCADSLSTSAFRDSDIAAYTSMIKAYAGGLYMYLEKVYTFLALSQGDK